MQISSPGIKAATQKLEGILIDQRTADYYSPGSYIKKEFVTAKNSPEYLKRFNEEKRIKVLWGFVQKEDVKSVDDTVDFSKSILENTKPPASLSEVKSANKSFEYFKSLKNKIYDQIQVNAERSPQYFERLKLRMIFDGTVPTKGVIAAKNAVRVINVPHVLANLNKII